MTAHDDQPVRSDDATDHDPVRIERYIPYVIAVGLLGLLVSLYSLSDYSGQMLRILQDFLKSL